MTLTTFIRTPLGDLLAARDESGPLTGLWFRGAHPEPQWRQADDAFDDVAGQLARYFDGSLREFDLELRPAGTAFQRSVWDQLRAIPYGETRSYLDIARSIGRPAACRAVGAANGANPIPIIIPCHRVVGANGSLTGFGGGIDVKRRLLSLETSGMPLFANGSGRVRKSQ